MKSIPLTSEKSSVAWELPLNISQVFNTCFKWNNLSVVKLTFHTGKLLTHNTLTQAKTLTLTLNVRIRLYVKLSLKIINNGFVILMSSVYRSSCFKRTFFLIGFVGFGAIPIASVAASRLNVTLTQVESVALQQAPELKSLAAKSESWKQSAIAAAQLSDPQLVLGAMNVPVDSFSLSQEPMTQMQVGLRQIFPKGHSLRYRSLQEKDKGQMEYQKGQAMQIQILQDVRMNWINLYYWLKARRIVSLQKKIFQHLVKVTESMLANNQAQQKDVIRAQLELTGLANQLITINLQIETARAQLARWVGNMLANHANPSQLPQWMNPPSLKRFETIIKTHPKLQSDRAIIAANYAGVELAKQQFKPGVAVGVGYGFSQGHDMFTNRKRSDFLTAQVSIDLPLFPNNRQDRGLKASEENLIASQEDQLSHYRQLNQTLKTQYAIWQQQQKSVELYQQQLIPEANQYAEATLIAYQNTQTDFPTLARAYIRQLNTSLMGLKASVDCNAARINLLYLEGE